MNNVANNQTFVSPLLECPCGRQLRGGHIIDLYGNVRTNYFHVDNVPLPDHRKIITMLITTHFKCKWAINQGKQQFLSSKT